MNELSQEKEPKQKLTLAIDGEIIDRAKKAGINISAITEKVLDSITMEVKGASMDDLMAGYEKLFDVIKDVLRKYNTSIIVGIHQVQLEDGSLGGEDVFLTSEGGLSTSEGPIELDEFVRYSYSSPFEILQKLLNALVTAAERNRGEMRDLLVALRFVKALANDALEEQK